MVEPRVTLLSHTKYPIETVWCEWTQSRTNDPIPSPSEVAARRLTEPGFDAEVLELFRNVVAMDMPVLETLDFVFLLEDVSIALREQLVRHRIGHAFGGRLGMDLIPDLAGGSSFWSQSMRVLDMSDFAEEGKYHVPASVQDSPQALIVFRSAMHSVEDAYRTLIGWKIPPEDARGVIPLAATHRLTWKANYKALAAILRKRSCWIAQLGLWKPLIRGIASALRGVSEEFGQMLDPPCINGGRFTACPFEAEASSRAKGLDPGMPCPLHLHNVLKKPVGVIPLPIADRAERFRTQANEFQDLWRRDVWTGDVIDYEEADLVIDADPLDELLKQRPAIEPGA